MTTPAADEHRWEYPLQPDERPYFYLGTHETSWLARPEFGGSWPTPLFISHRRLAGRRTLPRAHTPWALDSGGFSELSLYGGWHTTPTDYTTAVRRYEQHIDHLEWAAPQDWMCEPWIIAKTGLTVEEHQRRTVTNYLTLRRLDPDLPFIPVLQGWALADYQRCARMYADADVDLTVEPLLGLGSVCRRQATAEIGDIVTWAAEQGWRLHGFGVKAAGLARYGHLLWSADSLAWSFNARRNPPLPGCTHRNCANCPRYVLAWRARMLARLTDPYQPTLPLAA